MQVDPFNLPKDTRISSRTPELLLLGPNNLFMDPKNVFFKDPITTSSRASKCFQEPQNFLITQSRTSSRFQGSVPKNCFIKDPRNHYGGPLSFFIQDLSTPSLNTPTLLLQGPQNIYLNVNQGLIQGQHQLRLRDVTCDVS